MVAIKKVQEEAELILSDFRNKQKEKELELELEQKPKSNVVELKAKKAPRKASRKTSKTVVSMQNPTPLPLNKQKQFFYQDEKGKNTTSVIFNKNNIKIRIDSDRKGSTTLRRLREFLGSYHNEKVSIYAPKGKRFSFQGNKYKSLPKYLPKATGRNSSGIYFVMPKWGVAQNKWEVIEFKEEFIELSL